LSPDDSIAARQAGAAALDDPAARRRADCVPAKKITQIIENSTKKNK